MIQIRLPAFFQPAVFSAAKAGFQITHFAALRFAFGMTAVWVNLLLPYLF
jgi:hypothetical protein